MALRLGYRHPRAMRLCGRLSLVACVLVAVAAALAFSSARATGAHRDRTTCSWGASSVRAEVVDGRVVVSQPATSGCTP